MKTKNTKYDIITFGSATEDIFLKLKKGNFRVLRNKEFITQKALCFSLGSKIELSDLKICSGGGGTNTAATFSEQGFKIIFCGKIGQDLAGEKVLEDLRRFKINTCSVKKDNKRATALSVILSTGLTRTVLIHRGACHFMQKKDILWQNLKTKWFYLAPLSGKSAFLFPHLVNFAKRNKIKTAVNIGNSQINLSSNILKPIFSKIDILILNQQEAALLTKTSYQKENEILRKLNKLTSKIIVMTKGKRGVVVSDKKYKWSAGVLPVKSIEKTGAGDAFGAGFLSGLIRKNDIAFAIQLGTANAAACLQKTGTKQGLLKKGESWQRIKVIKKAI